MAELNAGARDEAEVRALNPGVIPAEAVRAELPTNDHPLIAMTPERRPALAEWLARQVALAPAYPEELADDPSLRDTPQVAREVTTSNVCAGCRGHCCKNGADTAYLTLATMQRYNKAHPEKSSEQVIEDYLAQVPAETYEDSCIFHSATGCALPRSMRSQTCRTYYCSGMQRLREVLPEDKLIPVLALYRGDTRRAALLDERGLTPLSFSEPEGPTTSTEDDAPASQPGSLTGTVTPHLPRSDPQNPRRSCRFPAY